MIMKLINNREPEKPKTISSIGLSIMGNGISWKYKFYINYLYLKLFKYKFTSKKVILIKTTV
jgi:hypothetical protein